MQWRTLAGTLKIVHSITVLFIYTFLSIQFTKKDGMVIIDCVASFYEEGEGDEYYRNKNKFRCRVSRIEKHLVKIKERIW